MADTQREIYVAATTAQAHLLKNVLERQGIRAFIANESLQIAEGKFPMGIPTAPRILVAESDAEEARQIAISFDESSRGSPPTDEEAADAPGRHWPQCPSCNRPRHTSCPYCGTAGANFPLAFVPSPALETRAMLVLCGTCDEPFEPQFNLRCEWCGHRFADGSELPTPEWVESEMTSRAWIALVGIVAVVIGAIALFAYIAPRP
jgi:rubrerythrin